VETIHEGDINTDEERTELDGGALIRKENGIDQELFTIEEKMH